MARKRFVDCRLLISDIRLLTTFDPQSEERLPLKFSKLVETVSKKPILPHVKHLIVEVMASDEDYEDVEVPFIVVHL